MNFELSFKPPPPFKVIIMIESHVSFYSWSCKKHLYKGVEKLNSGYMPIDWNIKHQLQFSDTHNAN
jgi:hypothetical protein